MSATPEPVGTFEASLDRLDVGHSRVAPGAVDAALAAVVRPPTVVAGFPFDGLDPDAGADADATDGTDGTDGTGRPTTADVRRARTGVTPAALAVADYGSVLLPSTADGSEPVSLFPELHVPVVRASAVVPGMPEAFAELGPRLRADRGSFVVATGPSATADMGALVRGAHGPREVHVVIVEDRPDVDAPPIAAAVDAADPDRVAADGGDRP